LKKIKVLMVDDHVVVRQALRETVAQDPDIDIVGEAGDGQTAVDLAASLTPDVVVLDLGMPGMNGMDAARVMINKSPQIKLLVLSMHSDRILVEESLRIGAAGYLVKQDAVTDLIKAIRTVAQGRRYLSKAAHHQTPQAVA
jgi:DNA-binding NarL/FixJ family response regulator